ncbi:MAG TPA: lipid II flippase MurJ, partial [Patescibacteria group bacterium]|nr:lipid II flippase MurJ [Patescibacteria group bacterium]
SRDTLTPVAAAVLAVAINVSLAIVLTGPLGLAGVGVAIAIGSWVEVGVLLAVLTRRIAGFEVGQLVRSGGVALGGAIVASGVALITMTLARNLVGPEPPRLVLLVELALAAGLAGLAYAGLSRALRIPELGTIVRLMSDALRRPVRA